MFFPAADTIAFAEGATERMRIVSGGNIGIGTTTPQAKLSVSNGGAAGLEFFVNYPGGGVGTYIQSYNRSGTAYVSTAYDAVDHSFRISGTERMRINSSGNTLIGTSNTPSNKDTSTPKLVVSGSGVAGAMQVVRHTSPGVGGSILELTSTRGTDVNSYTILQADDGVGALIFAGADGNEFVQAASIVAAVDGTPGDNDMPGRLVFSTTADGGSGTTERLRIASAGQIGIGGANYGTSGQVLTSGGAAAAPSWTDSVTPNGTQTLTNKTLTNPSINAFTEGVTAIGTVTTTSTLSLASGTVLTATLTASTACTFTMPTATAGKSFVLLLKQAAATGNGTATFTSVKWSSSGAPTITAAAGKMDILSFISDGTNWYGSIIQGYTP